MLENGFNGSWGFDGFQVLWVQVLGALRLLCVLVSGCICDFYTRFENQICRFSF